MKYFTLLSLAGTLWAQIYVYDANGRRVPLPSPEEKRSQKVIDDGNGGRIVEETIERRDVNGNKLPPEKVRTVERKAADGSKVVETTVFTSDLNGRLAASERSVITTQQQGSASVSTTVIERPTVNGTFAAVEKTTAQTTDENGRALTNRSTFVLDQNGNFVEAVRERVERAPEGSGVKEVVQEYRNAQSGKMELSGQRVKVDIPNPDGSTTSEVTIYGAVAQGRAADGKLKLREQQLITTKPGPGNTQVESISIRRPDLSDSKLGAYQKVGEKITQKP
ncbi:MAG: hypothetical protein FJW36_00540 [Acidobacteria bacterium]|nr:hypothetical protein [Acidobacteriota bacterium]